MTMCNFWFPRAFYREVCYNRISHSMEGDFYSMEKTPNYQLNQWAMSDRIQMKDFNDDNTRLETALTGLETMKLGFEKVFDVSATLDKVSYWPVDISELHAGDSLAIFLLFSMSTSATYGLCLGQGRSYSTSVYAPVTAFMGWPLRNPGTPVVLLPIGGCDIISKRTTIPYSSLNYVSVYSTSAASNPTISGTFRCQGFRIP